MKIPQGIDKVIDPHSVVAREIFVETEQVLPNSKLILLCFTNRCGSNLVAEALASSDLLNVGGEYFNHDTMGPVAGRFKVKSLGGYINALIRHTGKSSFLCAKVAIAQIKLLNEHGILDEIRNRTHYLLVRRSDLLDQAISLEIASQNRQWTSNMATAKPDDQLVFSTTKIHRIINDLSLQNELFMKFFAINGLKTKIIDYEMFVDFPEVYLRSIGQEAGIQLTYKPENVKVARQHRGVNLEWRNRFLESTG